MRQPAEEADDAAPPCRRRSPGRRASATARFSADDAIAGRRASPDVAKTAPIGLRARQVAPENATSVTNFSQRVCRMSSVTTASSPIARRHDGDERRDDRIAGEAVDDRSGAAPPGAVDHARLADAGAEIGASGGDAALLDVAGDHLPGVDPVLQGDDPGVAADQRRERPGRRVGRAELHGDEDEVDGSDRRRIVGGVDAGEGHVAERALQPEAVPPQRLEVRAPGDEVDRLAGLRQPRPDIPADAAGAHDRDAHARILPRGPAEDSRSARGGTGKVRPLQARW